MQFLLDSSEYEKECFVVERDDIIHRINSHYESRSSHAKYRPIIISTSKGMGKTFLLKKIGLQQVNEKCSLIEDAKNYGRILSFDFLRIDHGIKDEKDIKVFFKKLMIYYACIYFDGYQVDNINFTKIDNFANLQNYNDAYDKSLIQWMKRMMELNMNNAIKEYIRLTNVAFQVNNDSPPIFLLDEIQVLSENTQEISREQIPPVNYTQFAFLLKQLAVDYKPLCLCTGTSNHNIMKIMESTIVAPLVLNIFPFQDDLIKLNYWNQLTKLKNEEKCQTNKFIEENDLLVQSLINASYSIPRLMKLAHNIWYNNYIEYQKKNLNHILELFESEAIQYYSKFNYIFSLFEIEIITYIILNCGVSSSYGSDPEPTVIGTNLKWSDLVEQSLVFPNQNKNYTFPFTLVWKTLTLKKQKELEDYAALLIPNLKITDLFINYDSLCSFENYNLGIQFEKMIISSLAVKYHLINFPKKDNCRLSIIYDIKDQIDIQSILNDYQINLSEGIIIPETEYFVTNQDLKDIKGIVHNSLHHNAHHDAIIPSIYNNKLNIVAISVKSSFASPTPKVVEKQLLSAFQGNEKVDSLFWFYLGNQMITQNGVIYLNGSGCANDFSLKTVKLFKRLKSHINK